MLKNFWLYSCLILSVSPLAWAADNQKYIEQEDEGAVYRADETGVLNQERQEIYDRGLINDTEGNPMQYDPDPKEPVNALEIKKKGCTPTAKDNCDDIVIE